MDVVLVSLHYVYAEIGVKFDNGEYFFDGALHLSFNQPLPVFAYKD